MENVPRQCYTDEFKAEAVKLVKESGMTISEAGRRLNLPAMTFKNWVYKHKSSKPATVPGRPVMNVPEDVIDVGNPGFIDLTGGVMPFEPTQSGSDGRSFRILHCENSCAIHLGKRRMRP